MWWCMFVHKYAYNCVYIYIRIRIHMISYYVHLACAIYIPTYSQNGNRLWTFLQLLAFCRWQCRPVDTLRGARCIFGLDSGCGDGGGAGGWGGGPHGSPTTLYTTLASRRCSEGTKWCIATGCSYVFSLCHRAAPGTDFCQSLPVTKWHFHSTSSFFSAQLNLPGDLISVFASGAFTLRWFAAKLLIAGCSQEKWFAWDESTGINGLTDWLIFILEIDQALAFAMLWKPTTKLEHVGLSSNHWPVSMGWLSMVLHWERPSFRVYCNPCLRALAMWAETGHTTSTSHLPEMIL